MIFKMMAAIIIGIAIGFSISKTLNKDNLSNNKEITNLEELVQIYEENEKELKNKIDFYKNGMNATLKQNIYLKRKLNS